MRVKMPKQPPPAPTASAVGPCPTVIQIVGRPGTGSLPRTIAPPDHLGYIQVADIGYIGHGKKMIQTLQQITTLAIGRLKSIVYKFLQEVKSRTRAYD